MKSTFASYTLIKPFPKGRDVKLRLIIFTLLALALSACGTTPTPELGTGVDEYGSYTIVAQSGEDTLSTQDTTNRAEERVIELRRYDTARYSAALRIRTSNGSWSYKGNVAIANYTLGGTRLDGHSYTFDRSGDAISSLLTLTPTTMKGPRVCASADGTYRNTSGERYERTDSYLKVCVKTYGK